MNDDSIIDEGDFTASISNLPLVSIDLLVENTDGSILLGKRENSPAKNYWFVPGGRIRRMENFKSAFLRIANLELGREISLEESQFHGVFQHMYENSAFSEDVGSHYVSIALRIKIEKLELENIPQIQHREYRWFRLEEIKNDTGVHARTKEFFFGDEGIRPQ